MFGNEAFARGLFECGCRVVSSYPGTPSTEITEYAAQYEEIYSEWAPNEKVAMETAHGAAIAGARAFCGMKHVGLNVAADPLYTASYTGVNAGLVIGVADDPGMHSSQNEQDSRHHAIAAKVPMLEPADSSECRDYVCEAFNISEQFDTPVIVRLTTRIAHSQSIVDAFERVDLKLKDYQKNPQKYVMMPAFARGKHVLVEERTQKLISFSESSKLNHVQLNDSKIGVITSGVCYQYAKEALGDTVSYLKLGIVNPLPQKLILDFAAKHDTIYVIEELDDIIETHCIKLGINVIGKELFGFIGEISQAVISEKILNRQNEYYSYPESVPVRPPVMCAGCPHRGIFFILAKNNINVMGDIGCYTLGASAPLSAMDTAVCMGASVSSTHGFNKARGADSEHKTVGVIGDSTFIHSGITGLVNISYNASNSTIIILDNSITGMTGHQQNPSTGYNIHNEPAAKVCLEDLCRAVGINRIRTVDPYNLAESEAAIMEEISANEPSVIIARRPCALLKSAKHNPPFKINPQNCKSCRMCLKIGCPAISMHEGKAVISPTQCVGCGICMDLCRFNAIGKGES